MMHVLLWCCECYVDCMIMMMMMMVLVMMMRERGAAIVQRCSQSFTLTVHMHPATREALCAAREGSWPAKGGPTVPGGWPPPVLL